MACADEVTRRGMRILANPLPGDQRIVSGSGLLKDGIPSFIEPSRAFQRSPFRINENALV